MGWDRGVVWSERASTTHPHISFLINQNSGFSEKNRKIKSFNVVSCGGPFPQKNLLFSSCLLSFQIPLCRILYPNATNSTKLMNVPPSRENLSFLCLFEKIKNSLPGNSRSNNDRNESKSVVLHFFSLFLLWLSVSEFVLGRLKIHQLLNCFFPCS